METPDAPRSQAGAATAEKPAGETKPPERPAVAPARAPKKVPWGWIVGGIVLVIVLIVGVPWVIQAFNTVTTDDAYVNGHVTLVAPRVLRR